MKVIDLLNKIANGDIPKRIEYGKGKFHWNEKIKNYEDDKLKYAYINWDIVAISKLNDEVEIIEEDKKIKKICIFPTLDDEDFAYENGNKPSNVLIHHEIEKLLINKINEIIDKLDKGE